MVKDESDSIQTIAWNVAGKIKSITRYNATTKPDLEFRYDAMGHRIVKIVKPKTGSSTPYTLSNEDQWEYTYYIRDANGNTMATYTRNTTEANDTLKVAYKLQEHTIYGSSRVGVASSQLNAALVTLKLPDDVEYNTDGTYDLASVNTTLTEYQGNPNIKHHYLGKKQYELTNHLGNVLATISDIKEPIDNNSDEIIDGYNAQVKSAQLYYPYGALARRFQTSNYRYGFGGFEKDNEMKGDGNSYDMGERLYDPRIVRPPTIDPLATQFPSESPYIYAGNNPIYYVDKEGMYKVSAENEASYRKDYPLIMKYLSTQIETDISNSTKIINGLIRTNPNIQSSTIKGIAKWGSGPEITFKEAPGEFPHEYKSAAGFTPDIHEIQMNAGYATYMEKVLSSDASNEVKQTVFTRFYMTLIHETAHELNKYGKLLSQNDKGNYFYEKLGSGGYSNDEQGYKAEEYLWGSDNYKPFTNQLGNGSGEGVMGIKTEKYKPGITEDVINKANKTEAGKKSLPTIPTQ